MTPNSKTPTRKVTAATAGAAFAALILAVIPGKEDPELAGAIITVSVFAAGYVIREG